LSQGENSCILNKAQSRKVYRYLSYLISYLTVFLTCLVTFIKVYALPFAV